MVLLLQWLWHSRRRRKAKRSSTNLHKVVSSFFLLWFTNNLQIKTSSSGLWFARPDHWRFAPRMFHASKLGPQRGRAVNDILPAEHFSIAWPAQDRAGLYTQRAPSVHRG